MDKVKALALFSGGLDSVLSAKIVMNQGIEVEAIYFVNAFLPGHRTGEDEPFSLQKRIAEHLGIKLNFSDISTPHLKIVQNPHYGYGGNANPCIDCRDR